MSVSKKKIDHLCEGKVKSQKNINKVTKDLIITKKYLKQKFNDLINDFINKFNPYLNNYINMANNLYNNLYIYSEEKKMNKENIRSILNEYQNISSKILINNNKENILKKIYSNNDIDISQIPNIITNLENNLFQIDNQFYQNNYMKDKEFFLEYPEEILLKINQSVNNLKINKEIIKNKINLSFDKRINDIISSIKNFIYINNKNNLEYIKNKINNEDVFEEYFNYKINMINEFFDSLNNNIN